MARRFRAPIIPNSQKPYRILHIDEVGPDENAELALSPDVLYHLVEDHVISAYMRRLFAAALDRAIIYSSDENRLEAEHVRHRKVTPGLRSAGRTSHRIEVIPNSYPFDPADPENTSFTDFYIYGA
jgi:hypothetical protein